MTHLFTAIKLKVRLLEESECKVNIRRRGNYQDIKKK